MNTTFSKLSAIADANGFSQMKEKYAGIINEIYADPKRRYAVLGDGNSGKSTVLNALTGKSSAPVSLIVGKHDRILTVPSPEHDCTFIEIGSDAYSNDAALNPLWKIDAAVYILSALNPMTADDVSAINACIALGVPCTVALNKLNMVDDDDVELTVSSIKSQLFSRYQSEELIIFDRSDPAPAAEKIIAALNNSDDSRDVRESAATVAFVKELDKALCDSYTEAKTAYESLAAQRGGGDEDELFWESMSTELEKRRLSIITKVDSGAHSMYAKCNHILLSRMTKSSDPEQWWKRDLPLCMKTENEKIAQALGRAVEKAFNDDREWMTSLISNKFDIDLKTEDIDRSFIPFDAMPQNISGQLDGKQSRRKAALTGLAASALVLAGGLVLPFSAITTLVTCSIAGVAAVGTGFWTYLETQNAEEEKNAILRRELDKYVAQCRDTALTNTKNYIGYCYENLLIAAKDAQMLKMAEDLKPGDEESRALSRMTALSNDKKAVEEIISDLLLD